MSDAMQPAGAAPQGPVGNIPFTREDEQRIVWMSRFMTIAAVLAAVTSVIQLGAALLRLLGFGAAELAARHAQNPAAQRLSGLIGALVGAGIAGVLSVMLLRAGQAFARMATTEGSDQDLLAGGLRKLRMYFLIKSVLILLAIAFLCVLGPLLAVLVGAAAAATGHH